MQKVLKTPILILVTGLLVNAMAAEQSAVVNEGKINVRGQPALIGEVVTQLQKGDAVTVLEYVTNSRAKAGEPTNWARIKLPSNTPVWVYGEMVKDGAVAATRLNLRAGPGENYSVIGRLNRGDKVSTIRTMGDWVEIEAPTGAYAFVDASLLKASEGRANAPAVPTRGTQEPAPLVPEREPSTIAAAPTTAAPKVESLPETALPETSTPPRSNVQDALASPIQPPPTREPVDAGATTTAAAPAFTPPTTSLPQPSTLPQVTARAATNAEPVLARRIVRREGIIRPTVSIQAPTWYELVHPQTKKVIDYLHEEKMGVKLKEFKGQKVIVSGEEAVDPRWPNTPILELETLDIAP